MTLEWIGGPMTVCQVRGPADVDWTGAYVFAARTPEEWSLVCPTRAVPADAARREDGWAMFRVAGTMEFSLVGVLSRISGALAAAGVGLFAVSTYDTDYVLVKAENARRAEQALACAGFEWRGASAKRDCQSG